MIVKADGYGRAILDVDTAELELIAIGLANVPAEHRGEGTDLAALMNEAIKAEVRAATELRQKREERRR